MRGVMKGEDKEKERGGWRKNRGGNVGRGG